MPASDHYPDVIPVECPLCGELHLFVDPPKIRSAVCGHCDYYVTEKEWHDAFMKHVRERVLDSVGDAVRRAQGVATR